MDAPDALADPTFYARAMGIVTSDDTEGLLRLLRARVDVLHAQALARRPACRAMLAGRRSGIARRLDGLRREIALIETLAAAPRGDGGHAR